MTPDQLAKSGSEHSHQVALFAYCAIAKLTGFAIADVWADTGVICEGGIPIPELEWLHAIPNGGARGDDAKTRAIRGGALKAEGVRSGIPDVFLPVPIKKHRSYDEQGEPASYDEIVYCGLYIEMKKPDLKPKKEGSKGGLSDEQLSFRDYARNNHYGWIVCYSWREAVDAIKSYLAYGD